jgi:hypothetical protein
MGGRFWQECSKRRNSRVEYKQNSSPSIAVEGYLVCVTLKSYAESCANANRTRATCGVAFPRENNLVMVEKGKRMSLRVPLVVGGASLAACGLAFLGFGLYIYWDSPKLINFLAAWIAR